MTANTTSRGTVKLTAKYLNSIKATGKREACRDAIVAGLLFRVAADGASRVWYLDYRNAERRRRMLKLDAQMLDLKGAPSRQVHQGRHRQGRRSCR